MPQTVKAGFRGRVTPCRLGTRLGKSRDVLGGALRPSGTQGDPLLGGRCESEITNVSSNGTTPQVDQVTHTEAFADFPQLRAAGREETAQQSIPAKLLDLNLPALGATAQPLENPGQLRRDRRLSLAKKPAGVVDQLDIASQRKARNHAFTGRIQLATVLDRTKPQRLFQTGRRLRTGNAAATRLLPVPRSCLELRHGPLAA